MSERKVQAKEKPSLTNLSQHLPVPTQEKKRWLGEMSRQQALAVCWTGLQPLATNGQVVICNDKKTGIVWFGIANAKVVRDENMVKLIDTSANASAVLAEEQK